MDGYPALALIIRIENLLAWGVAGVLALAGLFMLTQGGAGFLSAIMVWVFAALAWICVKAGAEIIQVFVRIEEDTRSRA